MLSFAPLIRLRLVSLSSGLTLSFFTSAAAWLFTAVWSVIICWANLLTSLFLVLATASLPASISIWFAVTTIPAIWGSEGAWAYADPNAKDNRAMAMVSRTFMASPSQRKTDSNARVTGASYVDVARL